MAIYNKPDENVFASSARQGEVSNFPDIGRGWGISFDQTGGIPPMEWFNFLFKRTDEKFGYLFQRGLSEWSATQTYPEGALVQYKNLTYKAKRANTNKNPEQANSLDWQRWGFTQSELKSATLTESGITQLLTSINSDDETKSATPKSVKMAYDKGVEAKTAADDANTNANGRVSKRGDAIDGDLRINGQNGNWSKLQFGTQRGVWALEVHPESHNVANRRFNMKYTGDSNVFLSFPTIGDNGEIVAYRSWVEGSYLPLTGGKITGNLEIDRGNDYAGVILHNKSKIAIIESTPDSENQFLNLIYRTRDNQNVNVVKVPKKTGTLALLEDIKNVHRRDYNRTINGTSNWDNGKSKTITLTGSVTIYPDGRIVQILHLKNFRIMWFDAESPTVGYANAGYRHPLIKIPLWSAMPNKILSAMPQMVRTTHPTTSTTYVSEAGEWISAWAIREQGNDKGNVYINTRRFTGDADEIVDLYVVIEGY